MGILESAEKMQKELGPEMLRNAIQEDYDGAEDSDREEYGDEEEEDEVAGDEEEEDEVTHIVATHIALTL